MSHSRHLILCGGASVRSTGEEAVRLQLSGPDANVILLLQDISRRLIVNIPDVLVDLLEIAAYVYVADTAVSRGGLVGQQMGADWRRSLDFVIPVRCPEIWNQECLSALLSKTLSDLCEDNFSFRFERLRRAPTIAEYLEPADDDRSGFTPDDVILFSGGLDLLAGTIAALENGQRSVTLVSHRFGGAIERAQKELGADLRRTFGAHRIFHVPMLATVAHGVSKEATHRTRSFLFAAFGAVIAKLFRLDGIKLFENGIIIFHLPLSPQVIGARATRTTHPKVLAVGKPGRLGAGIRCVVSVSMLTEGWDANTVTHILGVRAFGTQLLCEQVVGRGLRRQSYDLNEQGLFNPEYADILGIPFDFTAAPVVSKPVRPKPTIRVHAVSPARDHLEIRFPRVEGYRTELPKERLTAAFTDAHRLELTPELVGPTVTRNQGIIGEAVDLTVEHLEDIRKSQIIFEITNYILQHRYRDPGEPPKLHLFGQMKGIVRQWLDGGLLTCTGETNRGQLLYREITEMVADRIQAAVTASTAEDYPVKTILDPYNPTGSTSHVSFTTSKETRWDTSGPPPKCHLNWIMLDSDWEAEFCRVAERHPRVTAYVKNHALGFEIPYRRGSQPRKYLPDFILRVDDGRQDPLNLIVEISGYPKGDKQDKVSTVQTYWLPGINALGTFGRWEFVEFTDVYEIEKAFSKLIEGYLDKAAA